MDLERKIMSVLVDGKGPIFALRSLPISIRRLFVHAYQSYVYNKCLSIAILEGEDIHICTSGDLCFEIEKPLIFGKIKKFSKVDSYENIIPAIRLVGYNLQAGKDSRFDNIIRRILHDDEILPSNFYIKELQELSLQTGFRQTSLCCTDFMYSESTILSFKLPKGSYATTLLRELIKPKDPIKCGF